MSTSIGSDKESFTINKEITIVAHKHSHKTQTQNTPLVLSQKIRATYCIYTSFVATTIHHFTKLYNITYL